MKHFLLLLWEIFFIEFYSNSKIYCFYLGKDSFYTVKTNMFLKQKYKIITQRVIRVTDALSEQRVTDPNFLGKDASSCFSCGPSSFYIVKTNTFLKQKYVSYAFKTFGLVALTSQKDFKIRAEQNFNKPCLLLFV